MQLKVCRMQCSQLLSQQEACQVMKPTRLAFKSAVTVSRRGRERKSRLFGEADTQEQEAVVWKGQELEVTGGPSPT